MLAIFDDQVGLYLQIRTGAGGGRTQAALIQLIGNGLADALFGQVTHDPWIIGTVLHGGLFPAPATIGGKVAAGIEVMIDLVGGAGSEQRGHGQ